MVVTTIVILTRVIVTKMTIITPATMVMMMMTVVMENHHCVQGYHSRLCIMRHKPLTYPGTAAMIMAFSSM
jgi:hypothetical protein